MSEANKCPVTSDTVLALSVLAAEVRGDELAEQISRFFADEVDRVKANKVVVDLKAVTYITSTGIRPLLALHHKLKLAGGRIVLCNLHPDVAEILHVMRFIDTAGTHPAPFEVRPDVASAVSSLLAPPPPPAAA
jgi:anti-anti-sigma factor